MRLGVFHNDQIEKFLEQRHVISLSDVTTVDGLVNSFSVHLNDGTKLNVRSSDGSVEQQYRLFMELIELDQAQKEIVVIHN